jgi:hypothetical protein
MTYDPSKTQEENLADLQAQIAASDLKYHTAVREWFNITAEEWSGGSEKFREIACAAYDACVDIT